VTKAKLLVVVDDNWRFALHVWRQLTGAMEFAFDDPPGESFSCESPDGLLEVQWHNPADDRQGLETYVDRFKHTTREPWTVIDVRGVPSRSGKIEGWAEYHKEFIDHVGHKDHAWVMSAYGSRRLGVEAHVRPKTIESLRALQAAMGLVIELKPVAPSQDRDGHLHVLVTGAGFELKEKTPAGVSIGCPRTCDLLAAMRPGGSAIPGVTEEDSYPRPYADRAIQDAVKDGDLDRYWDAVLSYLARNARDAASAREVELSWREAFRRALLTHDVGHQIQSVAAAQLDWHYWLTTNYTRFADRAIDLVGDMTHSRPWRAITTPIEADAVSPFVGSAAGTSHSAPASQERVIVKLHGDIGHVWTMAIAGHDKQTDSPLFVRPQLYRMYALAEAMLLESLWQRPAQTCTWHVVGHALFDRCLLRLIGSIVERSNAQHYLLLIRPDAPTEPRAAEDLAQKFTEVGKHEVAKMLRSGSNVSPSESGFLRRVSADYRRSSALSYMTQLSRAGLRIPEPTTLRIPDPGSMAPLEPDVETAAES
jgi:hypothetical protein